MENTFSKAVSTHRGNSYQDSRSLPTRSRFTYTLSEPRGFKQLQNTLPCHITTTVDEREESPGLHPLIWTTVDGPWPPWLRPLCFSALTGERRGLGAITAFPPDTAALCRVHVLCKSPGWGMMQNKLQAVPKPPWQPAPRARRLLTFRLLHRLIQSVRSWLWHFLRHNSSGYRLKALQSKFLKPYQAS